MDMTPCRRLSAIGITDSFRKAWWATRISTITMVLLACGGTNSYAVDREGNAQDVSLCQLSKDPALFSGRRVRVRAVYVHGFEVQLLEPPSCCPEIGTRIWVQITTDLDEGSERLFRRKLNTGIGVALVTFVGVFETGISAPGGIKSRLIVDEIERVERTSRAARRKDYPSWVPNNCEQPNSSQRQEHSEVALHQLGHFEYESTEPRSQSITSSLSRNSSGHQEPGSRCRRLSTRQN